MAERTCWNCVYASYESGRRLRHQPPRCANHPQWPGWLHDVPGVLCRNYQPRPAEPPDDIRRIPLGQGRYAYVDAADYEWLNQSKWHFHAGYAMRHEGGKRILMHRAIMRAPKGKIVDHRDGNQCNNYRANLRICTRRDNARNTARRTGGSSRYKGVCFERRRGKWRATVELEGHCIFLGYFDDEVEAARAYDRAAVERFGVFARPNFPEDWPVERREEVHTQWLKANGQRKGMPAKAKRARRPAHGGHQATSVRATRRRSRVTSSRIPSRRGRTCVAASRSGEKKP